MALKPQGIIQSFMLDDFPLHVRLYNRRGRCTGETVMPAPDLDPMLIKGPLQVGLDSKGAVLWAEVHTARGEELRLVNERLVIADELRLCGLAFGVTLLAAVLVYLLTGALPLALAVVFAIVAASMLHHMGTLVRRWANAASQPWLQR